MDRDGSSMSRRGDWFSSGTSTGEGHTLANGDDQMKRALTLTLALALAVVVSTCGGTRPDAVPSITASTTQTSVKLSWRAADGARTYRARLWPGGTGVSAAKATAKTSQFTHTFSDL